MEQLKLTEFAQWYGNYKDAILKQAKEWNIDNEKQKAEFRKQWPLEKLKKIALDDYVIGKGPDNNSFCYQIDVGAFRNLCLSIGGGTSGKFGIYYSKADEAYKDSVNKIIPEEQLEKTFKKLRHDLIEIIELGLQYKFDDPVFNEKTSNNDFLGKSAMIMKLLCIYSDSDKYTGINLRSSQTKLLGEIPPKDEQGSYYKQNFEMTKMISNQFPELNGELLSAILWRFKDRFDKDAEFPGLDSEPKIDNNQKYKDILLKSKNMIFRGAPGTGKSFLAKEIASEIVSDGQVKQYRDLSEEQQKQVEFVQFHPSYDYTDFVEGLRPTLTSDGSMSFKLEQGIFSKFVKRARHNLEDSQKSSKDLTNEVFWKNTMENFFEKVEFGSQEFQIKNGNKYYLTEIDDDKIYIYVPSNAKMNTFTLEIDDLTKMLKSKQTFEKVKDVTDFFHKKHATQQFSYYLSLFNEIKSKYYLQGTSATVEKIPTKPYVFIIDEINRGEISKIFGELFFSIDPEYRGMDGSVSTQYSNMHVNQQDKFYVPENVYIIGTMNDIDRSVDTFDFAMRRRFRFVNIKVDDRLDMLNNLSIKDEAIQRMKALNKQIVQTEDLDENYQIGAAYFMKLEKISPRELWDDFLEPLLKDYIQGMYAETEIMQSYENAYFLRDGSDK